MPSQVLKVAILAEKYATDYEWYVDTILSLIRVAGDYVSEEVRQHSWIYIPGGLRTYITHSTRVLNSVHLLDLTSSWCEKCNFRSSGRYVHTVHELVVRGLELDN
jgi:hypothetical protein